MATLEPSDLKCTKLLKGVYTMSLLSGLRIGTRLYVLCIVFLVALSLVAAIVLFNISKIKNESERLYDDYVSQLEMLAEINVTTGNLFLSYRNYYLEYPDQERMQVRLNDINNRTNFIMENLQDYLIFLRARHASREEIANVEGAIQKIQNEVLPANQHLIRLMQSEQLEEARLYIIGAEMRTLRSSLQDDLIAVIFQDCMDNSEIILQQTISDIDIAFRVIVVLVIVTFVLTLVFSTFLINSIVMPLKKLTVVSKEVAEGNLNVNLNR